MEASKRYSFVSLFFILKCLLVMLKFFLVDIVVISYSDAIRSSKYNYNISFSRSYIFCTINCNKFACLIESISLSGITVNKKKFPAEKTLHRVTSLINSYSKSPVTIGGGNVLGKKPQTSRNIPVTKQSEILPA